MRKTLAAVALACVGMLFVPTTSQALYIEGHDKPAVQDNRIPGVLIVNFKADGLPQSAKRAGQGTAMGIASIDELNQRWYLQAHRPQFPGVKAPRAPYKQPDLRGFQVFTFDQSIDLDAAAAEYEADPNVAWVEFDYYAYLARVPNDPYYTYMWALNQSQDHDIDAPEAWDVTPGDSSIILADTDTGVLYSHEDLIDNIWVNPGEDLNGDGVLFDIWDENYVDDDSNGYVDDFIGYDFVEAGTAVWPGEDGAVKDNNPKDFHGHGTHTSGTIAATTNNGIGVAGVAGGFGPGSEPGCRIMCLRIGYSFNDGGWENGRTHMSYVAEAFRYAADNGARAINYSFGSSNGGGIESATSYAVAAGIVISASAGNDNNSSFGYLQRRSDVLCVASTTSQDRRSSFSNYGSYVDICAPGSSIRSTVSYHYTPGYATWSGTSMSAPHVVGLVGLILSRNPVLTRQEVFDQIVDNADNIDALNPGYEGKLGSGRINAYASLQWIASTDFSATPTIGDAPLTVQFTDESGTPPTAWDWDLGDGTYTTEQNPEHTYSPGLYDVTLTIDSDIGGGIETKTGFVAALAETVTVRDTGTFSGQPVVVDLDAVNHLPVDEITLPIIVSNIPAYGYLDSVVTTGCRTDGFDVNVVYDNHYNGEVAMQLTAADPGTPLDPGSGPIAKVYLRMKSDTAPGDSIIVDTGSLASQDFEFAAGEIAFVPVFHAGAIAIGGTIGDLNDDGQIDPLDMSELIDILFTGAPPTDPEALSDANCDGQTDPLDLSLIIDYIFTSGPPPCS